MKEIKCWRLDVIGGAEGEHLSLAARFGSEEEAHKAEPACGGYGGKVSPETIKIYTTAFEYAPQLNEDAATSGLAKLTQEERAALGLE